ncbi:MAG: N-acyl homoserine lactonase family protein [Pseudomonadota bacterium]
MTWDIYAVLYAEQTERKRGSNYMFVDDHDANDPIDFYFWVLRQGARTIVVDTGFDSAEGVRRGRPVRREPHDALAPLGVRAEDVDTLICTHLHFDHAGGLHLFPNAQIHLQAREMAYATGPCMCHQVLRSPFTADHVVEAVRRLYQGKITYHDGDGQIAPGVTVHHIGGHTKGLQAVRVETQAGTMVLASDAAHFYGNMHEGLPMPIVVDVAEMLDGHRTLARLAGSPQLIVPGHDPMIRTLFPRHDKADFIWRLDRGLAVDWPF